MGYHGTPHIGMLMSYPLALKLAFHVVNSLSDWIGWCLGVWVVSKAIGGLLGKALQNVMLCRMT
jgi:hypothetical protein